MEILKWKRKTVKQPWEIKDKKQTNFKDSSYLFQRERECEQAQVEGEAEGENIKHGLR